MRVLRERFTVAQLRTASILAGGAAGALARAGAGRALPPRPGEWPWATFGVNIAGALLLAWLTTRLTAGTCARSTLVCSHASRAVRSHVDDRKAGVRATAKDPWLFSRDCLEVQIALDADRRLTLLVNHLKSNFIDHKTANTHAKAAKAPAGQ